MSAKQKIFGAAFLVLLADQLTKQVVLRNIPFAEERILIEGFFKLVHWGNTGAAWSLFPGYNKVFTVIALIALVALYLNRQHFQAHRLLGQLALGLMFGGILGNLIDRFYAGHVIDFIRFYLITRSGAERGFPAFNVADTAICTGVGLLFLLSIQTTTSRSTRAPINEPPVPSEPSPK